jgi:hypothetical protein
MENKKNNLYTSFEYFFDLLEKRPLYFVTDNSYNTISVFVQGYFYSLGTYIQDEINYRLSVWINEKGKNTALIWTAYILGIESNDDEEIAKKNLFIKIKEFFNDPEIDLKQKLESINIPINS